MFLQHISLKPDAPQTRCCGPQARRASLNRYPSNPRCCEPQACRASLNRYPSNPMLWAAGPQGVAQQISLNLLVWGRRQYNLKLKSENWSEWGRRGSSGAPDRQLLRKKSPGIQWNHSQTPTHTLKIKTIKQVSICFV